jgi:uncharacterized membrane protein
MYTRKDAKSRLSDTLDTVSPIGQQFVTDQKLRKRVLAAVDAGLAARRRAQRQVGAVGTVRRLGSDPVLRAELTEMLAQLQAAQKRIESKRRRRARSIGLLLTGTGIVVAAVPPVRDRIKGLLRGSELSISSPATVKQEIEVAVPVKTAYNQWTQFEEFPKFMEGVDEVTQLDDTLLHWAATVGGKRAEWDSKIVEQEPDRRIVWESVAGKNTRGIVSFEEAGPSRTRIHLSMTYSLDGVAEKAGAVVGLDNRRVRGDLERFRALIESQGTETGSWRGEIHDGERSSAGRSSQNDAR